MTFEEVYSFLEKEKDNLNFEKREDFSTNMGISTFHSLKDKNIPEHLIKFKRVASAATAFNTVIAFNADEPRLDL